MISAYLRTALSSLSLLCLLIWPAYLTLAMPLEETPDGFCKTSQFPQMCSDPQFIQSPIVDVVDDKLPFVPQLEPLLGAKLLYHQNFAKNLQGWNWPSAPKLECGRIHALMAMTYLWDLRYLQHPRPLNEEFVGSIITEFMKEMDFLGTYFSRQDVENTVSRYAAPLLTDLENGTCTTIDTLTELYTERLKKTRQSLYEQILAFSTSDMQYLSQLVTNNIQEILSDSRESNPLEDIHAFNSPMDFFPSDSNPVTVKLQRDRHIISMMKALIASVLVSAPYAKQYYALHPNKLDNHIRGPIQKVLMLTLNTYLDSLQSQPPSFFPTDNKNDVGLVIQLLANELTKRDDALLKRRDTFGYSSFIKAFFHAYERDNLLCENVYQITHLANNEHFYNATAAGDAMNFDDDFARRVLVFYMESLDPFSLFFLKEDVDSFLNQHAPYLDSYLHNRQCQPLLDIARVLRQRVTTHLPLINQKLTTGFDFSVEERGTLRLRSHDLPAATEYETYLHKRLKTIIAASHLGSDLPVDQITQGIKKRLNTAISESHKMTTSDYYYHFISAFFDALSPHNLFLFGEDAVRFARISTGEHSSFGLSVRNTHPDFFTIISIIPGSEAEASGLQPRDRILAIREDGSDSYQYVSDLGQQFLLLNDGPAGSRAYLLVQRKTDNGGYRKIEIPITRSRFHENWNLAPYHLFEVSGGSGETVKVGVVMVHTFASPSNVYESVSYLLGEATAELKRQGAQALIIDLSFNAGGSLYEATKMIELFVQPEVTFKQQYGDNTKVEDVSHGNPTHDHLEIPLILLVNQNTASSSEVVSQALAVHGRGVVVGEPTFGKGSIQYLSPILLDPVILQVDNPSDFESYPEELAHDHLPVDKVANVISITHGLYFGADGSSTQRRGVPIDVPLPSISQLLRRPSERDYEGNIEPRDLKQSNQASNFGFRPQQVLTTLSKRSSQRIATNSLLSQVQSILDQRNSDDDQKVRQSFSLKLLPAKKLSDQELFTRELNETQLKIEDLRKQISFIPATDQNVLASKFEELEKVDTTLSEALMIARDYYLLCAGEAKPTATGCATNK